RRVGAAVRGQERGDLVHPVQRVTLVDDPGVLGDRTVEQDARLLVLDRVQDTAEEVAQRDATLTVVTVVGLRTLFFTLGAFLGTFLLGLGTLLGTFGVRLVRGQCLVGVRGRTGLWVGRVLRGRYVPGLVLGVEGVVVLLLGLDDDVVGPLASVVDPWFVLAGDLTEFTPRRDVVLGEDRTALVVDQVARGGDHSVTVGVDQVSVQPVVLVVRGALQLADGDDRVGQVTFTVLVAVDLQHVRVLE